MGVKDCIIFYTSFSFYFKYAGLCNGRFCGEECETGICDGNGNCVSPEENPCEQKGCEGKFCGDQCLLGDILGACDVHGNCEFNAFPFCDDQGRFLSAFCVLFLLCILSLYNMRFITFKFQFLM